MVALRSARIESLLGVQLGNVEASHIKGLIDHQVAETFDLDYKGELYGTRDQDKRDLAGDVAALANTAGGIIILGIVEDDQARAESASLVELSEDEKGRMQKIIASNVAPIPVFDILPIANAPDTGQGFYIIAVPRSPMAPHAVLVNQALRYPRRNGSDTRYLSEPEVADAYRSRISSGRQQLERLEEAQIEAVKRLERMDRCWIVISLVPDLEGNFLVDNRALRNFQLGLTGRNVNLFMGGSTWSRFLVGRRRLIADGTLRESEGATHLYTELHGDGVGVLAIELTNYRSVAITETDSREFLINDEETVEAILSGLLFLGKHAQDRAAAGGNALIRLSLYPITSAHLSHARNFGGGRLGSQRVIQGDDLTERVFPLDEIATEGSSLVTATYILATDLFQAFGHSEALQLDRDGRIRIRYWSRPLHEDLRSWAGQANVKVSEETLA
jgi:schlafen family protein